MPERSAYDIAVGLLARREHSRVELEQKLSQRGCETEAIDEALDRLEEAGLQSDERFLVSFARARIQRGQGPVRIRAELARRGLGNADFEQALAADDETVDWYALAGDVLERKWPEPPADLKERQKAMRFLAQRGFPANIVAELLSD